MCLYLEGLTLIILKVIIEIYTCILCAYMSVCVLDLVVLCDLLGVSMFLFSSIFSKILCRSGLMI